MTPWSGVTGVLGKIYPLKTLEKVSYLPLKYTLKKFQCRCMNPAYSLQKKHKHIILSAGSSTVFS
jgi:hypothetical protein